MLGLSLAGLSSCDDFLTKSSEGQLPSELYYTKLSDCEGGLTAVYNAFKAPNIYNPSEENMRSDIAVQGNVFRTSFTSEAYLQKFNNASTTANNKWAALYKGVYRANQLLEGLEKVKPNLISAEQEADWTQIKAQAHFFRGLFYFWLSESFNHGAVPIIDFVPKTEAEMYHPVSKKEDVVKFYRDDLNMALELGLKDKWDEQNTGRVTSYAVKAVLGQSYLYEGAYDEAKAYFKDIIDNGGYELADVADNITTLNEFNSESILEVGYTTDYNTEFGQWSESSLYHTWGMNFSKLGWNTTIPAIWLVEEYENEMIDERDDRNWLTCKHTEKDEKMQDDLYNRIKNDIIYEQAGTSYEYTSTSLNGDTVLVSTYVYRYLDNGKHDNKVTRRVIKMTEDGDYYVQDAAHLNPQYFAVQNAPVHTNMQTRLADSGDNYERLVSYSRRASYSIAINGEEDLAFYKKIPQQIAQFHNNECGYFRKLCNWDIYEDEEDGTPARASGINLRLIRLADIYLMYAECLIKGGADENGFYEALKYVNKVRERAGTVLMGSETNAGAEFNGIRCYQNTKLDNGNYADLRLQELVNGQGNEAYDPEALIDDAQKLMKHIMYVERPLELCVEGFATRVIDLRRWGVTKQRFQELAKKEYVFVQTNYLRPGNAEEGTENVLNFASNWCKLEPYKPAEHTDKTPYADYRDAAGNYNESVEYWPIPNVEVMSNPYID